MADEPELPDTQAMHKRRVADLETTIDLERKAREKAEAELQALRAPVTPAGDPDLFDLLIEPLE